ncbi:hypothetical protein AAX05_09190 [Moraxella bovoculi]|uniref:Lipoprotein n=2 Tax=Moraxella bovoculi TaxID=386891 RepID=A0AAC8PXA2_9GAMM|nr:hypothetical protein AAX06_10095 [Moraxella bovoculi]AKG10280.1 hypothetical protein AAX05_09190 [Moraxella bovoculi]AKG12293.1 hypothetical protein AAX07_10340 [Moraxella bovoculi]AKG14266.1 hypothetical protein AAX11_09875 [Moraxella bovoculi]
MKKLIWLAPILSVVMMTGCGDKKEATTEESAEAETVPMSAEPADPIIGTEPSIQDPLVTEPVEGDVLESDASAEVEQGDTEAVPIESVDEEVTTN